MNAQTRSKLVGMAMQIPHDTTDLRLAIKREMYSRGLSASEVADRMNLTHGWVKHRLCPDVPSNPVRITAVFLERLIEALHITPAVARRLHYLAATDAGWRIAEAKAQIRPPARSLADPETAPRYVGIQPHRPSQTEPMERSN